MPTLTSLRLFVVAAFAVCALGETEHPGHLNVRGVLRRFAAVLLRQKA